MNRFHLHLELDSHELVSDSNEPDVLASVRLLHPTVIRLAPHFLPPTTYALGDPDVLLYSVRPGAAAGRNYYCGEHLVRTETEVTCIPALASPNPGDNGCPHVGSDSRFLIENWLGAGSSSAADSFPEPQTIEGLDLQKRSADLAATALMAQHWPSAELTEPVWWALMRAMWAVQGDKQRIGRMLAALATVVPTADVLNIVNRWPHDLPTVEKDQCILGWFGLVVAFGGDVLEKCLRWIGEIPFPNVTFPPDLTQILDRYHRIKVKQDQPVP